MPRKKAQVVSAEVAVQNNSPVVEELADVGHEPSILTKEDYLKARATIKSYRESQKNRPKRKCSDKQLAALAAGREKNKRFAKKQEQISD